MNRAQAYYDLDVIIEGLEPAPRRRFLLYCGATLQSLHEAIQRAFEWRWEQFWSFRESPDGYGLSDLNTPLIELFGDEEEALGKTSYYFYDKEVKWTHRITVKGVVEKDKETKDLMIFRELLEAEHIAPIEACRNAADYQQFLTILETGEKEGHAEHLLRAIEDRGLTLADVKLDVEKLAEMFHSKFNLLNYIYYIERKRRCSYVPGEPRADFVKRDMVYYFDHTLTEDQSKVLDYIEEYCKSNPLFHDFDVQYLLCTWAYLAPRVDSAGLSPAVCAYLTIRYISNIFRFKIDRKELDRYFSITDHYDDNMIYKIGISMEVGELIEIEDISDDFFEFVEPSESWQEKEFHFTTWDSALHLLSPQYIRFLQRLAELEPYYAFEFLRLGATVDTVTALFKAKEIAEKSLEDITYRDVHEIVEAYLAFEKLEALTITQPSSNKKSSGKKKVNVKSKSKAKKARKKHR